MPQLRQYLALSSGGDKPDRLERAGALASQGLQVLVARMLGHEA